MEAFRTMWKIEWRLSLRDMNMVLFAIIMPLIVLLIQGFVYGSKEAFAGAGYSAIDQSFSALCTISICAGSMMGLPILVSDYRERKILKRFKVTPMCPLGILLVHLSIYVVYSIISMISLWAVTAIFFGFRMRGNVLWFLAGWILVSFCMLSIGMFVGGVAKNSQQASLIACILYFPMLIFSGATLPYEVMPGILQRLSDIMPLTQAIKLLKSLSLALPLDGMLVPMIVMAVLGTVFTVLSVKLFRWE